VNESPGRNARTAVGLRPLAGFRKTPSSSTAQPAARSGICRLSVGERPTSRPEGRRTRASRSRPLIDRGRHRDKVACRGTRRAPRRPETDTAWTCRPPRRLGNGPVGDVIALIHERPSLILEDVGQPLAEPVNGSAGPCRGGHQPEVTRPGKWPCSPSMGKPQPTSARTLTGWSRSPARRSHWAQPGEQQEHRRRVTFGR
jgi:hypothetical protein